jgi:hypothetical protein
MKTQFALLRFPHSRRDTVVHCPDRADEKYVKSVSSFPKFWAGDVGGEAREHVSGVCVDC